MIAASGCITVVSMERWGFPWQSILLGLLVGLAAGLLNGVIIAYSNIHPFVVTLVMQNIYVVLLTYGKWTTSTLYVNERFPIMGTGSLGKIPYPIIYMLIGSYDVFVIEQD